MYGWNYWKEKSLEAGPTEKVSGLEKYIYILNISGRRIKFLCCITGASLVAQRVKHLPAMQEIWVWSLGQEDPLEYYYPLLYY